MYDLNFERQIENLPKKGSGIKDLFFNKDYFLRSTEFETSAIEKEQITFSNKTSNSKILITTALACFFICFRFKEKDIFISMLLFTGISLIVCFIFLKNKKEKIIKINNLEIEIENSKFDWRDIYDFGVLAKPNKYYTYHELIIFSHSKGKKNFNLYGFQSDTNEILKNINYFKKKYEISKSNQNSQQI